jgi:hypothetical protein
MGNLNQRHFHVPPPETGLMGQDGCVGIPWEQPPLCDPIEQAFVSMLTQPRRLRLGIRLRRGPIVEIDLRQVYTLKSKHGVEVNTISCEV